MKGTVSKYSFALLAVLALVLVSVGLFLASGKPAAVKAAASAGKAAAGAEAPVPQKPDNSACLGCHSAPGKVYQFPNGDTVSVSVDQKVFDQSVHSNLDCKVCHSNISGYPHPQKTAQSAQAYTQQYKDTCKQCHPNQVKETADSAHAKLTGDKAAKAPTCGDCHNPHTQSPIAKDKNGDPAPSEHAAIATTCSKCHSQIVNEFKDSVHGKALFQDANMDVPACNDCHGIHNISQARTVEFRLNSPQLCATCHTRADIMDKYGISTNVMNTYVSDFHGTTVTLFSKEHTGADTNKPVCYDCHGIHNIASVKDPQRGLEIKQNMLATCQKCHPDASENFPTSWMSHYIATPTRFPLVYYVNLFYKIFIPTVLGGMGLFVLSDILHRLGIIGRSNKADQSTAKTFKEE